jgi:F-type H+-transporting ATPase subunit delta
MLRTGIAQRYAKALFQAALDAGVADEVFGDAENLATVMSESPMLQNFLGSPQVPTEDKHGLLDKALGGRTHKLFLDFLHVLMDKKRIMFARDIAEAYRYLYEKHKGIVQVKAITAVPLEDPQREKLVRKLEEQTKKAIQLTHIVDPNILGGMILKMEDRLIDGSVRYQLEELKRRLMETKVMRAGAPPADAGS